jgi:hypothetical protein
VNQPITLQINIRLYQPMGSGTISIDESVELPTLDFLEMSKVLGQFHDLVTAIQARHAKVKP